MTLLCVNTTLFMKEQSTWVCAAKCRMVSISSARSTLNLHGFSDEHAQLAYTSPGVVMSAWMNVKFGNERTSWRFSMLLQYSSLSMTTIFA
jgi:hypothetical protein